ncbi:MAG: cytochrome c oxidase assembly protein [Coxiella sp. RIFCSPHIGHO2_12_FULL_44_14]|nr:MAG: cytochrome c oxidase assembly protein [Coxiella sp. RIFCSPHIGHO2_12_FULL_44_14]
MSVNHHRLLLKLILGVLFMFGFAYMLVPLYTLVCKKTGINGKGYSRDFTETTTAIDFSRTITVQLTTTVQGTLPFQFHPLIKKINVHPGETKKIYFYAENNSGKRITVQAIPSIAPGEAARYLKKTQCFCFTQQIFAKKERVDMPVIFHIDPEIPPYITYLTLNYTLFDATLFPKKAKQNVQGRIQL